VDDRGSESLHGQSNASRFGRQPLAEQALNPYPLSSTRFVHGVKAPGNAPGAIHPKIIGNYERIHRPRDEPL
jgi:hypothetical protein